MRFYRKANEKEVIRNRKFIKVIPQNISEYISASDLGARRRPFSEIK